MTNKIETFSKTLLRKDIPEMRPGDVVRVTQKFTEEDKVRRNIFEGIIIARKHGKGISATITVRRDVGGVGVERIFPIHSPTIEKIEILERYKTRRAKLYYLRRLKGKGARLKKI